MLVRARMLKDAEYLLLSEEARGGFVGDGWMFSEIIQGYVNDSELENSIALYDKVRERGIVLLASCYKAYLNLLVRMKKTDLAERVYADMIEVGLGSHSEHNFVDFVVEALSKKGRTFEAVNILRKLKGFSVESSPKALTAVAEGYCKKKDHEDALNFLKEWNHIPEARVCNKIVSSLCSNLSSAEAWGFVERLEDIGFEPDAITFGILISQSCRERKLRDAFIFLSEGSSRSIKLDVYAYNALIGGLFKEGMYSSVKNITEEMIESGLKLGLATFKILLAGYCKYRKFDDVKKILEEMTNCGMISLAPSEDTLSKDEAAQWGKNLSLSTYSKLLKGLCQSSSYIKSTITILDETPELVDQLDFETLNHLIQYLSKNGAPFCAISIVDQLFKRNMVVESDTYTVILLGLCKERNIDGLRECLQATHRISSLLWSTDIKKLISFLCKFGMVKGMLEIFDSITEKCQCPNLISVICNDIVRELCIRGFTDVGYVLVEEFLNRGLAVDNVSYISLIEGFIKEQKFDKAQGIIDGFLEKNMAPDASIYELIVPQLFKFNIVGKVMSLKQTMLKAQPKSAFLVYKTLVNEFCKKGKMNEAAIQLHEMLGNKVFPDSDTLNALLQGYCHVKSLKKALEILCVMLRKNFDLSLSGYRSLIHHLCTHDKILGALRLKEVMEEKCDAEPLVLHNILIFYLFKSGHRLLVEALLKKMLEKHLFPTSDTFNFLAYGYYKCGDASRSIKLLDTVISENMKPSNRILRKVICYLCSDGNVSKALELSKVMEYNGWKHGSVVLHALTEGFLSNGEISKAEHFLYQMEEKDMMPTNIELDLLIKKFCVHGCIKKAVDLLNLMLKKGSLPSEISYSLVIKGLSIEKLFDQAFDFHAEMLYKTLEPTLDACNTLVCGLCDNGRTDEARIFLGKMLHFGPVPSSDMYNYVIDKYYAQNNLNKASELLYEMQQVGYSPTFETHWSFISNLSCSDTKDVNDDGKGFLSRLL
ncbi:pentatricopeptide repeat-containing protein At5g15280 [Asparagus officinalis]|uniref:pentatricopeptide repeat-containing protein At5g15280 n=1 Tax=Asparagus officinalis TaxID=4686 RepID=UPI00098DE96E|nr:pentatricopeptide repeat-containing protein At5g15280 [Asparagus officinalis]